MINSNMSNALLGNYCYHQNRSNEDNGRLDRIDRRSDQSSGSQLSAICSTNLPCDTAKVSEGELPLNWIFDPLEIYRGSEIYHRANHMTTDYEIRISRSLPYQTLMAPLA